jgi:acyl dehydratase
MIEPGAATFTVGDVVIAATFPAIERETLRRYAHASGDSNPMHVDPEHARRAGFDDVFAHGMLVMAYLGRAVTARFPQRSLRSFSTRFVARTLLGDVLSACGTIVEITVHDDETLLRIDLTMHANSELKVRGEATIALATAHAQ